MAVVLAAGMLSNPVMSAVCSPMDYKPRQKLIESLVDEITAIALKKVGINITED